jgi:hypothetical protein
LVYPSEISKDEKWQEMRFKEPGSDLRRGNGKIMTVNP